MLIVAPKGIEKLHTRLEIPIAFSHISKFVGIAALLELSENVVSIPGKFFLKNFIGLRCAITRIIKEYTNIINIIPTKNDPIRPSNTTNECKPVSVIITNIE